MSTKAKDLTRRLIYVVIVAVAIGLFVLAGQLAATDRSDGTAAGGAVERLIPAENSETFQGNAVGVDLAPGWALLNLQVDGVEIPEDEWNVTSELGLYQFQPGEGQIMQTLPPVRTVTLSATIFTLADPSVTRTVTWDVQVL